MPLIWIALTTFLSEDLALVAAGALVAKRSISLFEATAASAAGIFAGDLLLFFVGRLAWKSRLFARIVRRWVSQQKIERASFWINDRGLAAVLLSRFTPGLRLPTYVAAGLLGGRTLAFASYFLLAALLWTPLIVAGSAFFGERIMDKFGTPALLIAGAAFLAARSFTLRRRIVGFCKRKLAWEFWPAWAAYLPLAPYLLYLAIRHRSLTLFTLANPGIEAGGFAGESKTRILRNLIEGGAADLVAPFAEPGEYPVVLKPDVGERGAGVVILRSGASFPTNLIAQRYIPGLEFGVYYVRHPQEDRGRVVSITEKRFPSVTGDGVNTLEHLILRDPRAVCMAAAYRKSAKRAMDDIPARGETVQLVELGSHCRGAVFLNGITLWTKMLEDAVERVARAHPGFYLGRFDIRAESIEAFQQGRFKVIELNGVSAEPAHIYDPSVSLLDAYRAMAWQWRTAFEFGAWHREQHGVEPMSLRELIAFIRERRRASS